MNMGRSMLANTNLPNILWTEALKMEVHILNRVTSKSVPNTPLEMWMGRQPSLKYMKVWGCPAETKLYNPHQRKLDMNTVSCFFVGYLECSKGYRFCCPWHTTRIVETQHAEFLENSNISGSNASNDIKLQEVQEDRPIIYVPFQPFASIMDNTAQLMHLSTTL